MNKLDPIWAEDLAAALRAIDGKPVYQMTEAEKILVMMDRSILPPSNGEPQVKQYPRFETRRREIRRQNLIWKGALITLYALSVAFFAFLLIDAASRGTAPHPDCPTHAC